MGSRGPIPKRAEDRIRRNKEEVPTETVVAFGTVEVPELDMPDAHPLVVDMYESLRDSAQSRFYEPSDWQYARMACYLLDEALKPPATKYGTPGSISPMKIQNICGIFSDLLVSEGDRRRVKMEIEREQGNGEVINLADEFEKRFAK